jgi:hypothetical protein
VFVMEGLLVPEEEVVGRKEELPGGSLPRVEVEVSKSVEGDVRGEPGCKRW